MKTVVQKALKAIDLMKDMTKNARDKIEKTGKSIRERMAEAKARVNQENDKNNRDRLTERSKQRRLDDEVPL